MSNKKYLWAFDISLRNTGLAIYDLEEKKFIYVGSFLTEKIYATKQYKGLNLHALKLKRITEWIKELYLKYPPEVVAMEQIISKKKKTAKGFAFAQHNDIIALSKVHGVIQCMLWKFPMEIYSPTTIKKHVIKGNASKDLVQDILKLRFPYIDFQDDDQSDAVAVAVTYLVEKGLIEWKKPLIKDVVKTRRENDL
ncbi:holliday junction resolvase [Bacillus phage vB_BanS-Thrax1]|nr:holliday junction resolvase [Bacillus phage vB_BanS-Thrax1]